MVKSLKMQNPITCYPHYLFSLHVICCVIAAENVSKNAAYGNQPAASGPVYGADQSNFGVVGASSPYYQVFIKLLFTVILFSYDLLFVAKSAMWINFLLLKWLGNSAITVATRCSRKSIWRKLSGTW